MAIAIDQVVVQNPTAALMFNRHDRDFCRRRNQGARTPVLGCRNPRIKAVAVVQKRLEDGWKASLTDQKITLRQAHKLKLRLNGAC